MHVKNLVRNSACERVVGSFFFAFGIWTNVWHVISAKTKNFFRVIIIFIILYNYIIITFGGVGGIT